MNNKKVFDSEFNGEMFWRQWNARAYFSINMRKLEKDISTENMTTGIKSMDLLV